VSLGIVELLQSVVNQLAVAIDQAELYEQACQLSTTWPQGLNNPRQNEFNVLKQALTTAESSTN